jgi:hypothetical protein
MFTRDLERDGAIRASSQILDIGVVIVDPDLILDPER